MVDFSKLLTPNQLAHIDAFGVEMERLYRLPDRWLAAELLRLARSLRSQYPERLGNPYAVVYEPNFVWHVVPEVARRLGGVKLLPNEAALQRIRGASDIELRSMVGSYLKNMSLDKLDFDLDAPSPTAGEVLGSQPVHGNPVAFAIDRLAPALDIGHDQDDWLARSLREVSRFRGIEVTPYWSPECFPRKRRDDQIAEEQVGLRP